MVRNPTPGLYDGQLAIIRSAVAAIAAEASLTDANFPPASTYILTCRNLDSIFVGVDITGGASPSMTIDALIRDDDAPDGSRWKNLINPKSAGDAGTTAQDTGALTSNGPLAELNVFGFQQVLLRVKAVANAGSTTAWKILAMPGRKRLSR